MRDLDFDPFRVRYRRFAGAEPSGPPDEQAFWAASASGSGEQVVTWDTESGEWTIVLMNADASDGVAADVSIGAEANFLLWLAIGLLVAGVLVLAVGVLLIVLGARGATSAAPAALAAAGAPPAVATVYPVALRGELDPQLGRWLWLVKWLLAIPALHRARVPLDRALGADHRRVLRHPLHRPLPARDLRLQPRRAPLDVARPPSTPTGRSAPTGTRPSRWPTGGLSGARCTSTTRSGSRTGSRSSSGSSPSRT